MRPASGNALYSAGSRITQDFGIDNAEPEKPVLLKFRLSYIHAGRPVTETGQVANLV
jgi:hypothetical protein